MMIDKPMSDKHWMQQALDCAKQAEAAGEVPVGAVLVQDNQLIAKAYNQPIKNHDPTAHAEIQVLRAGAQRLGNYRLLGTTLYVTLEPCAMCVGAMIHARVARVVFGAYDPKTGVVSSVGNLFVAKFSNHQPEILGGVMADACAAILKRFFKRKRQK